MYAPSSSGVEDESNGYAGFAPCEHTFTPRTDHQFPLHDPQAVDLSRQTYSRSFVI